MAISAQEVNKLRQVTGAGMMDCKKALEEANGNIEEAVIILRKKGQKISEKRADVDAKEGMVFLKTNADSTEGLIIALKCETDFVAKNEEFVKLGEAIVSKAIEVKPASIEEVKNLPIFDGRSAQDHITDLMGKIGEKIELSAYELLKADKVVSYTHLGAKLGVLLAITGTNGTDVSDMGKDIAMQIAAMKPVAIDKEDVSEELLNKELDIAKEKARNDGKPENIIDKIAQSALQSFFKENTLLNQPFVKDNSKTVAQLLQSVGKDLKITAFRRISVS